MDTLRHLAARNEKLAELLKASRDKLADLNAQLEQLAEPASTYGVVLSFDGRNACVFTSGRRMLVKVTPQIDVLRVGALVRLGEGSIVVEDCGHPRSGQVVTVMELIDDTRALVATSQGEESLVLLADSLSVRPGDSVLVDLKASVAIEVIARTEVTQLALEEIPDVTFADVGGLDSQIAEIRDSIQMPFTHPELYRAYELTPPKGVLLYGPPGCGKTMIAKAIAHSLGTDGSHFLSVKGPELLNKYVGETERRIRVIFERARELASKGRPVIIFFDEMEALFRTRGSGVSSDMETTVVPQLLAEMDGVEDLRNVIVVGATNREELIDPAILRPGRLDVKIRVDRPGADAARDIFARYITDSLPLASARSELISSAVDDLFRPRPYVRLEFDDGETAVLNYSDFVSGAMIANIVDRAKRFAIKDQLTGRAGGLTREHLSRAVTAEQDQSEDLPNTANPDEWSRIVSRRGTRVRAVTVIG